MEEIWKDVKGFEGMYQVSNKKQIRSVDRYVNHNLGGKALRKGQQIKFRLDKDGYFKVSLKRNQKAYNFFVHELVAIAFIPNPKNKPIVNHKDGDKQNCFPENLEWVTLAENRQHAYDTGLQNGLSRRGQKCNFNKLSEADVRYIKFNYKKNKQFTNRFFAEMFFVTEGCIQAITSGKNWKHVD